jgi:sugar/nucleoside kinase (ribokinase family)
MVYVIGAIAIDLIAVKERFIAGTSNPARIKYSAGGVGYRIFHSLQTEKCFITALGSDPFSGWLKHLLSTEREVKILESKAYNSACYLALMESGRLKYGAADMRVIEEALTFDFVVSALHQVKLKDFLVLEANLAPGLVAEIVEYYSEKCCLVFESVSREKVLRHGSNLKGLYLLAANCEEISFLLSEGKTDTGKEVSGSEAWPADGLIYSFLEQRKIENIIVTSGTSGVSLYKSKQRLDYLPQRIVESSDTTGAGDRFLSMLLSGLDRGSPPEVEVPGAMRKVEKALEEGNL